jgi:hypothetical protein
MNVYNSVVTSVELVYVFLRLSHNPHLPDNSSSDTMPLKYRRQRGLRVTLIKSTERPEWWQPTLSKSARIARGSTVLLHPEGPGQVVIITLAFTRPFQALVFIRVVVLTLACKVRGSGINGCLTNCFTSVLQNSRYCNVPNIRPSPPTNEY